MATTVRSFHLGVIGLAFLHLLAAAADNAVIHGRTNDASVATTELHASVLPHDATLMGAERPRSSHHDCAATSTPPDDNAPRRLGRRGRGRRRTGDDGSTLVYLYLRLRGRPHARSRRRGHRPGVGQNHRRDHALCTASARRPLPPDAALVVLSSLATPAKALLGFGSDCSRLARPTCAVYYYHYDNETGLLNRRRRDPTLNARCWHPLCHPTVYRLASLYSQQRGRGDDPLMVYCIFSDLISPSTIIPWLNIYETYMPIDDPAAVAASGDRVCYVELTHMNYREGYYIRCPNPYREGRHTSCTSFTEDRKELTDEEEVIAATLWEYRRLHCRDNVWPRYGTLSDSMEKHDEL